MNAQPNLSGAGRTKNRWKTIFTVFVCLAVLYITYRFVLLYAVKVRIDSIRRVGSPATCAEFDKWYTRVPAGENAADLYIQADEHYNKWTNALSRPIFITNTTATCTNSYRATKKADLLPIEGWAKLPPRTEQIPAEMKQLIGEYLADNVEALRLLHQAALMKHCRFPVDLSKGAAGGGLNHLSGLRRAARLLMLEAVENSENQRPEQAAESVIASLGLARALNQEPILISRLVAIPFHQISIESLERMLNRTSLTDEQLVTLAVALAETEDPQGLTRTFIGERCFGIVQFDQISWREVVAIADSPWFDERPPLLVLALYKPAGLLQLDESAYLDLMEDFVKGTRGTPYQNVATVTALASKVKRLPVYLPWSRLTLSYLDGVVIHDVEEIARTRTALASLAIERYRLATGKLPEKLGDLVPAYLDAIPQDPFDGKLLRYKELVKGYVVYSVGKDGEDNGGAEKNSEGLRVGKGTDITFIVER